jgi:phosphoribosylanthranilate isomerase
MGLKLQQKRDFSIAVLLPAQSAYLRAMSFLTKVKLGNITNLADARYAAAAGVDYMGFCFDPSNENYIAPIKAKEIIDWTSGSLIVAEFGDQPLEEIRDISELLNVDVIEVNNRLLPDELLGLGKAVIKKINLLGLDAQQLNIEIATYKEVADAFHLYGDAASTTDKEQLIEICSSNQVIWGLELTADNVLTVVETFRPYAINLSGGTEERAGVKDFDEMNDLFEKIVVE